MDANRTLAAHCRRRRVPAFSLLEQLEPRSLLAAVFGPVPQISSLPSGFKEVVADFDGDGRSDVVFLGLLTNSVTLLRGHGDGTFDAPTTTTLNVRASSLGAGDLFAGAGAELIASGGAGTPLLGAGSGGFRTTFIRVLRYNSDSGKLEVASVLTIPAPPQGDAQPSGPIFGEFTGDASPDIVFAPDSAQGRIVVLGGAGTSLRFARTIATPAPIGRFGHIPEDPLGADVNGDGRTDIVTFTIAGYVALLNTPSGLSESVRTLALSSMFSWRFADVDGDGKADAVSMWTPPSQVHSTRVDRYAIVRVKVGSGDGTFGSLQNIAPLQIGPAFVNGAFPADERETLIVGPDIDADGRADITYIRDTTSFDRSSVAVRERVIALTHSTDGGWLPPRDALPPNDAANSDGRNLDVLVGGGNEILADFNGDGRADLLDAGYVQLRVFLAQDS